MDGNYAEPLWSCGRWVLADGEGQGWNSCGQTENSLSCAAALGLMTRWAYGPSKVMFAWWGRSISDPPLTGPKALHQPDHQASLANQGDDYSSPGRANLPTRVNSVALWRIIHQEGNQQKPHTCSLNLRRFIVFSVLYSVFLCICE